VRTNYIALAIPVFFILIGVELLVGRLQNRRIFRFQDAITDLSCGIGQQVTSIFIDVGLVAAYFYVFNHYAPVKLGMGVGVWIFTFFAVDLAYYLWHRAAHRTNIIWAAHVVHHQSQDYNLAVALRQPWFSSITSLVFYLPMAFFGIPSVIFITVHAFNILYQFWIHTETIGTLGPLEYVLNTPSHHRVHHAINPKYIDKNYAGTLIIWDRLFGTFAKEDEAPVYGTVKPFLSWNALWANFEYFFAMNRESEGSPLTDKLKILIKPPEWRPKGQAPHFIPPVDRVTFKKFETPMSVGSKWYVFINFIVVTVATTALVWNKEYWSKSWLLAMSAFILFTLLVWAGLFENRSWAKPAEFFRLSAVAVFALISFIK